MAEVTHGNVLPDSAQKTDFYALIDDSTVTGIIDADISNGAGIQDTKLAPITTAGKVNVSALTGTIPNANLAQITNPALVSGAALTLLPNTPSGAGLLPAANVGGLLGSWTSQTIGQIYQATTDGWFTAGYASVPPGGNFTLYTDSNSSPATSRDSYTNAGTSGAASSVQSFVRKNDYYQVQTSGAYTLPFMYFISLGS